MIALGPGDGYYCRGGFFLEEPECLVVFIWRNVVVHKLKRTAFAICISMFIFSPVR